MLIKYYSLSLPQTLYIIDGIKNIHSPIELGLDPFPKQYPTDMVVYDFGDGKPNNEEKCAPLYKLIYFTKDGVSSFLYVYGTAYICNDDGKTIEKVSALY